MKVHASLTGPFPRSETLVQATRDLDRGRTTEEAVEELYGRAERDVLVLEDRLRFDVVTSGYLRWQDLFRPLAETWAGFTVGSLTRWFETNTFYRQPVLHAPPERTPGAIRDRLPPVFPSAGYGRALVSLPGPYTLVGLLENRSGETPEALTHRLGRLLADEVRELREVGYRSFQFHEPLLVVHPPKGPRAEAVVAAYRAIGEAAQGATSILWTYFGDASDVGALLGRLAVTTVGIDLAETDWNRLDSFVGHHSLGVGCLDPRTTLVEKPEDVAEIVRSIVERLGTSDVWLGPGGPLALLPSEPAIRKLEALPAMQRLLTATGGAAA